MFMAIYASKMWHFGVFKGINYDLMLQELQYGKGWFNVSTNSFF